jgi:hypothetical protein
METLAAGREENYTAYYEAKNVTTLGFTMQIPEEDLVYAGRSGETKDGSLYLVLEECAIGEKPVARVQASARWLERTPVFQYSDYQSLEEGHASALLRFSFNLSTPSTRVLLLSLSGNLSASSYPFNFHIYDSLDQYIHYIDKEEDPPFSNIYDGENVTAPLSFDGRLGWYEYTPGTPLPFYFVAENNSPFGINDVLVEGVTVGWREVIYGLETVQAVSLRVAVAIAIIGSLLIVFSLVLKLKQK